MPHLVDVHAHVVLEGSMGAAGPCGPTLGTHADGTTWFRVGNYRLDGVPYRGSLFMDAALRIEAMDEAGIALQALSPNPITFLHHVDAHLATTFCQHHNDALAEVVRAHPGRLVGLAALPMQDPVAAASELTRAVKELGLLGGYVGTDPGRALDDLTLDDVWATAVALDVPMFLHPASSGIDGPPRDPRLARFDVDLVVEFAFEEVLAVAALVFGGVLDRHPGLDVCISHGGGATPMLLAKLRKLAERRPAVPERLRGPGAFDAEVQRLWFDCHVTGEAELAFAIQQLGTDRLVYGTNFGGWDRGSGGDVTAVADVLNTNATRLLRLEALPPSISGRSASEAVAASRQFATGPPG